MYDEASCWPAFMAWLEMQICYECLRLLFDGHIFLFPATPTFSSFPLHIIIISFGHFNSDAFVFGPAPVFVYTQERTTPRPPPSTELLDLDPNSPRARGLCRKYNIKVVSDDSIGDRTGMVAEVVQAIGKVWERAMDPEASSDPSIRNLQAAFDKLLTRGDEFTEMDRMDLVRHSEIHQEALRSLPDSIATTSHYRYVLATLRREKDRLREQIDSDRDLVAAMDATLEGLRPFIPDEIPDKGKGRDKRDGPGFK
ncbi:uncharacterized protein LACBIDRAFT_330018 [Laccaria bicolor S238N-H82]|uniref:Predicted protein n=1 Tax=Laccaria bicolor (strain S238N-H82 / ATCC MYA-4686) TaxID=486041 RepID=B0DK04_LACBS|nr:uncharacterized protein LACBIDRAFT_330018 [Laccaria bicolor S238N-H82]EDR04855.1 predicted protein [Laccaria bicolor S238N-H82]|eukprot:XP_001884245.1 predicted protein [Laccaria bicolor S238N-H82]